MSVFSVLCIAVINCCWVLLWCCCAILHPTHTMTHSVGKKCCSRKNRKRIIKREETCSTHNYIIGTHNFHAVLRVFTYSRFYTLHFYCLSSALFWVVVQLQGLFSEAGFCARDKNCMYLSPHTMENTTTDDDRRSTELGDNVFIFDEPNEKFVG